MPYITCGRLEFDFLKNDYFLKSLLWYYNILEPNFGQLLIK
jgi:hypothetical protein